MNADRHPAVLGLPAWIAGLTRAVVLTALVCAPEIHAQTADLGISAEEARHLKNFSALGAPANADLSKLRLRNLLRAAEEYSPAIREAVYGSLAANEDLEAAKGARMPQVTATAQSVYSEGDLTSATKANGRGSVVLAAQYALYDWGRIDANIQGREQAQLSAYARQQQISRQLAVDAATSCLEFNKQRALLNANQEYLEKIQVLVDMLTKITEQDTGRRGELIQAKSRLLQGASATDANRSRVREVDLRLERLLGSGQNHLCRDIGSSLMKAPSQEQVQSLVESNPQIQILQAEYQQALKNLDQVAATRKPQVTVRAEHAPISPGVTNNYAQTVTVAATVPLYDGNTLKSSERAALERANAALERIDTTRNQISTELRERARLADANISRAADYVGLLEINDRVRNDFFLQWAALGRRSLFELLAIEAEQLTLLSGYYTSLYDGMIGNAFVRGQIGQLTEDLTP